MSNVDRGGAPAELRGSPDDDESADNGIDLATVAAALVVLALLVVGIFWGLPAWFGGSVITVTVRQ